MAHNIATINGKAAMAFSGDRKAIWHELGQAVGQNTVEWKVIANEAQLLWKTVKKPLFSRQPVTNAVFELPDMVAVHRDNDGGYLGTVGKGYELIQNEEMFRYVDDLLEAENGAHWDTAGALGNGANIWGLARLPEVSRIKGTVDVTENFLLFLGSHDGSTANEAKLCRTRVVCQNTLRVALGEAGKALKFKHTRNVRFRMDQAKKIWLGIHEDIREQEEKENLLATRLMTGETMVSVLNKLFPENPLAKGDARRRGIVEMVLELFASNDGGLIPEIKGTAYNMLNAVTEYADHFRGVRITAGRQGMTETQARAENALFGTGDSLKNSAVAVLLEETKDSPIRGEKIVSKPIVTSDGAFLKALGIRA